MRYTLGDILAKTPDSLLPLSNALVAPHPSSSLNTAFEKGALSELG
jgi:hypothetical protein